MRSPGMTGRLMVMAVILTPAFSGRTRLARSSEALQEPAVVTPVNREDEPTVLSLVHEAMTAADRGSAGDRVRQASASILARSGHSDEAFRLAGGDPKTADRASLKLVVAIALARAGDFAGALRTTHLLTGTEARYPIKFIAAEQAWAGDLPGAKRLVETELGSKPDSVYAYRLIAQVLEEKGDFAAAAQEYKSIPSLKEQARGCRPAALARLKAGDIPGALKEAEDSRRLASEYLKKHPLPEGKVTSLSLDIEPDGFRDEILGAIALEQAKRGDVAGARKTAESIASVYPRILTVAKAAATLAREGDRVQAKALIKWAFELAESAGYHGFELMEIATAETLAGETEAARKTFIRALATVGPAVMNQSLIPDAQAKAGDIEGALLTVEAITDLGAKLQALRYVARTPAKAGDIAKAIKIASGITSDDERALAILETSEAQRDAGDRVGALATLRQALAINFAPDGELLRNLARTFCSLSDAHQALAWVKQHSKPETISWGLLGIAEGRLPRVVGPNLQLHNP